MNSTIFVQPPNVITVGDVEPGSAAASNPESVAAVIRPVPSGSGKEGSLRIDQANTESSKTHIRTHQLNDYVNWLRDRVQADRLEAQKQLASEELAAPAPDHHPVTADLTTDEVAPLAFDVQPAKPATQQPKLPKEATVEIVQANRSTHASHAESDSFFSTIATDSQLVGQLTSAESTSQPVSALAPQKRAHGYSTKIFQRIDSPHRPEILMPTAHVTFTEEALSQPLDAESPADMESPRASEPFSVEDTETFISTISKAIASVLTEKSEPEFEEKVRTHFESELHSSVMQTIVSRSTVVPVEDSVVAPPQPTHLASPKTELKSDLINETVLDGSLNEIPTYVAAWDVEDFRWPSVTNRMIVSGGKAIDQLSLSIFDMISPDHQRVAITGLGRGEGTSSIAISLARWSAACSKKVLLVDADISSPTLSSDVGLAPNLSWINAVSQSLPPAEVIVRSQKTNLCVMPMSKMASRVTWPRFIFDNLGELINNVRIHFDLVILDMGPASQLLAELSRPEHLIDITLLVHDGGVSPEFNKTQSRLETFGLNKFIIAQNRAHKNKVNVA